MFFFSLIIVYDLKQNRNQLFFFSVKSELSKNQIMISIKKMK